MSESFPSFTPVDAFDSDVFQLGVCMITLSLLPDDASDYDSTDFQSRQWMKVVGRAKQYRELLLSMVSVDPIKRVTMECVHHQSRLILHSAFYRRVDLALNEVTAFRDKALLQQENAMETVIELREDWEMLSSAHSSKGVPVGTKLGEALCLKLCHFDHARNVFQQVLLLADGEAKATIAVWIVAVEYYRGDYESAVSLSVRTTEASPEVLSYEESYWTLYHYWFMSLYKLRRRYDMHLLWLQAKQRRFRYKSASGRFYRAHIRSILTSSPLRANWCRRKCAVLSLDHFPLRVPALVNLSEWQEATNDVDYLLTLQSPGNALLCRYYPTLLSSLSHYEETVRTFLLRYRHSPEFVSVLPDIGTTLARMRRFPEAEDVYALWYFDSGKRRVESDSSGETLGRWADVCVKRRKIDRGERVSVECTRKPRRTLGSYTLLRKCYRQL